MTLFSASDFETQTVWAPHSKSLAYIANHILQERLLSKAKRVYGEKGVMPWHEQPSKTDTHEALLIDVKEIVKECEHKRVSQYMSYISDSGPMVEGTCNDCNKKLKAKWEPE